jgi:hypothetical protein
MAGKTIISREWGLFFQGVLFVVDLYFIDLEQMFFAELPI